MHRAVSENILYNRVQILRKIFGQIINWIAILATE